jgi:hypothetical protein
VVARVMGKVCTRKGVSIPSAYEGNHNIPSTEPVKHASNSACSTSDRERRDVDKTLTKRCEPGGRGFTSRRLRRYGKHEYMILTKKFWIRTLSLINLPFSQTMTVWRKREPQRR